MVDGYVKVAAPAFWLQDSVSVPSPLLLASVFLIGFACSPFVVPHSWLTEILIADVCVCTPGWWVSGLQCAVR